MSVGPSASLRLRVRAGRRVDAARPWFVMAAVVVAMLALGACGGATSGSAANAPGQIIKAPSGSASAQLVVGAEQNGVTMLVPVIAVDGAEVYRDTTAYSQRHGVAITWQSDASALWIVSADLGTFRVRHGESGWAKTASLDLPGDVRARLGR